MFKKSLIKGFLFVFAGFISIQATGQMKQKVADRLYNELAFFKAVKLYEDLADRKKGTTYQKRRTAECYRLIGETRKAEYWYEQTTRRDDAIADDYYFYAQMLKANEKYTEAQQQLEKYAEKKAGESKFEEGFLEGKTDYVEKLRENADRYEISNAGKSINSEDGDFAPVVLKPKSGEMKIIFTSSRRNMNALNKKSQ